MKLLLLVCVITSVYGCSPRVRIKEGELVGTTYTLPNDRKVYAFLGIPYAAPPIGENRFKEPKPPKPWKGSKNAKSTGNACIQVEYRPGKRSNKTIGDEDCLFMNVFTPKLPENKNGSKEELMNVLFYIHGGGFLFGSSNNAYPDYILQDDDIVFVSFNYRIGALGFLSLDHPAAPGNYGLKDQVEALRWVHRNIRFFGGDPNKVTIYGNSAGGASVHYHMVSPINTGLFQSAIASSGSMSLPWSLTRYVVESSNQLASKFHCNHEDQETIIKCLRNIPAKDITIEESPFKEGVDIKEAFIRYGPVIETGNGGKTPFEDLRALNPGAFLPDHPYRLLKKGKVKQIPFMTSVVENEGAVLGLEIATNNEMLDKMNKDWDSIAPNLFSYSNLLSKPEEDYISSSIRTYYFGNEDLSNETTKYFLQALSDRHFFNGIYAINKLHSSVSPENSYCFKFYYRGTESLSDFYPNTNGKNYGVCHSDDMRYVLKSYYGNKKTKNDLDMAKLLCSSIIAFMKNGNPSTKHVKWEPMSKNNVMNCLAIYSFTYQRMEDIEDHEVTRFWDDLFPEIPEHKPMTVRT